MRTSIVLVAVIAFVAGPAFGQTAAVMPDALLQRGIDSYRAEDYSAAVHDLQIAAQAYLSPERMQAYVNTGRFDSLMSFEKSLVYLTLAQYRLGRENDARETVVRLTTAERIEPTYARLPLDPDAAEFEAIAARLVPGHELPRNAQLALGTPPPATAVAETPRERKAVQPTLAAERSERQKLIEEMVARERERIQREADLRIAAEREKSEQSFAARIAASEREAEERLAAERAASQRQTEETLAAERAAAQRQTEERLAAERAAAQRQTEERLAAERAASQRQAEARVAEAQRDAATRIALADALTKGGHLTSLRQAEAYATNDQVTAANEIYLRIARDANVPREILTEAAVGLYRTGAFPEAVEAFRRMVPFAKGEEDLRYYNAVALYETGSFDDAKKELACALPYIQVTDDVARYRVKIEQTAAVRAARND